MEERFEQVLKTLGVVYSYELFKAFFVPPAKKRSKTFDWFGPEPEEGHRWRVVETKGWWDSKSRLAETEAIKQNPELEILYLFSKMTNPINKGSKTTYQDWCRKIGVECTESMQVAAEWLRMPGSTYTIATPIPQT